MIRRNSGAPFHAILYLLVVIVLAAAALYWYSHWPRREAVEIVNEFYQYEQTGDYGSAWTLFHSEMKKKFTQAEYIQKRTKVFIEDLGAKTFTYRIEDVDHLASWRMSAKARPLKNVYRLKVAETFNGVFGLMTIETDIFVAKDGKEWRMLWKY